MELLAVLISVISLAVMVAMYFRISKALEEVANRPDPEPVIIIQEIKEEPEPEPQPIPPRDESHYGWRNETGIPLSPAAAPSSSKPPPQPGPRERPYGFPR